MKKHPPARRAQKKELSFPASVLLGAICSLFCGTVLLALSCIPLLSLPDPLRLAPVFAIACLFASVAVGANLAARLHGKSGLACGILSALAFILTLVALACALSLKIRTSLFIICAPALLLTAAIAGVCGVSEKAPKIRKHKPVKFR